MKEQTQNLDTEQNVSARIIEEVAGKIAAILSPSRIILYNCKQDFSGELTSFKLCIVGSKQDKSSQIRHVFAEVDSDIPYDVLIYTDEQFETLRQTENAFARHVDQKGKVLYGS